jgi:hypothetical protein
MLQPVSTSDDNHSAPAAQRPELDADLARLIEVWDNLPEAVQHNLRVIIRSTLTRHGKASKPK